MRRTLVSFVLLTVSWGAAVVGVPVANAALTLTVGMGINIGSHGCSLGFFGFNADKDRLAVTAGHCSDGVDWPVYTKAGTEIGTVVLHKEDVESRDGKLNGSRGYTVIKLYDRVGFDPFFADIDSREVGDWVTKYGMRSGKTSGKVTKIKTVKDRNDLALYYSTIVQLPGDSGCPWYYSDPAILVGMASSGDQEDEGGGAGSQAQPIWPIIRMIRNSGYHWGTDFKVWTK
ncbi:S1 family peptidase [Mycobacteroides chelonae]|uniref:S1 family peptidase n=1 Tax=Mycobacteroides chelonae TaxID=1774 RepID=UPI001E38EDBA|nr:S1 family peptidase [Mycobacteroides chelonae]